MSAWFSPTSHTANPAIWDNPEYAYDGNSETYARGLAGGMSWLGWLTLYHATSSCTAIKWKQGFEQPAWQVWVRVSIYYDSAWHDIYWEKECPTVVQVNFAEQGVSGVGITAWNYYQGSTVLRVYEFEFYGLEATTSTSTTTISTSTSMTSTSTTSTSSSTTSTSTSTTTFTTTSTTSSTSTSTSTTSTSSSTTSTSSSITSTSSSTTSTSTSSSTSSSTSTTLGPEYRLAANWEDLKADTVPLLTSPHPAYFSEGEVVGESESGYPIELGEASARWVYEDQILSALAWDQLIDFIDDSGFGIVYIQTRTNEITTGRFTYSRYKGFMKRPEGTSIPPWRYKEVEIEFFSLTPWSDAEERGYTWRRDFG